MLRLGGQTRAKGKVGGEVWAIGKGNEDDERRRGESVRVMHKDALAVKRCDEHKKESVIECAVKKGGGEGVNGWEAVKEERV